MVGASAGAIVAALISAGYGGDELREIVASLDYVRFKDEALEDRLPLGNALSILKDLGIYEGAAFEEWMRGLLEAKSVRTFRDLVRREDAEPQYRYKLQVSASDVTERRLLVLPRDAPRLGIDVARTVRMSIFFERVRFANPRTGGEHLIVDGGLLSNFPVWLFDAEEPQWPTIGMKLIQREERPIGEELPGPAPRGGVREVIGYLRSLLDTMMAAHDRLYVERNHSDRRTIGIGTLGVGTTQFDLSSEQALKFDQSGRAAAKEFLDRAPAGIKYAVYGATPKPERSPRPRGLWSPKTRPPLSPGPWR
jgi:NTE family protein